jgi:hypothetical protein
VQLRNRFVQEAPERWTEYARRAKALQGRFATHMRSSNGDREFKNRYEMKANRDGRLLRTSMARLSNGRNDFQRIQVFGINAEYAFILHGQSDGGPWTVDEMAYVKGGVPPPGVSDHFERFQRDVSELVSFRGTPLVEMVRRPEFHVVRCRKVIQGTEELAEVAFDYPHQPGNKDTEVGGKLLLGPQHFWCLYSYDFRNKFPGRQTNQHYHVEDWAVADGDLPVPKRAVSEVEFVAGEETNKTTWQFEYELGVPRRLPRDREFTLSAFGLPEPPSKSRTGRYVLLTALGLLFVVCLGALLRRRFRNRAEGGVIDI